MELGAEKLLDMSLDEVSVGEKGVVGLELGLG